MYQPRHLFPTNPQDFYDLMSNEGQAVMRRLDVVTVKGSEVPIGIYTYDALQDQYFREDRYGVFCGVAGVCGLCCYPTLYFWLPLSTLLICLLLCCASKLATTKTDATSGPPARARACL